MAYLLDANIFIQAKRLHYGFDFCPAFWTWLEQSNAAGTVLSIEKVGAELEAGGDDLSAWAAAKGAAFFKAPDNAVLPALTRVSTWAAGQNYDPAAWTGSLFRRPGHAPEGPAGSSPLTHRVSVEPIAPISRYAKGCLRQLCGRAAVDAVLAAAINARGEADR